MANGQHNALQALLHAAHGIIQNTDFIGRTIGNLLGQIAIGNMVKMHTGFTQGSQSGTAQHQAQRHNNGQANQQAQTNRAIGNTGLQLSLLQQQIRLIVVELAQLFNTELESGRTQHTKTFADEVKSAVVACLQGLNHRLDTIVQIRLIGSHQTHGQSAQLRFGRHIGTDIRKGLAYLIQLLVGHNHQIVCTLQHIGVVIDASFLIKARCAHQAKARFHHIVIELQNLYGTICLTIDGAQRIAALLQVVSRQAAHGHNQDHEQAHADHQHGADLQARSGLQTGAK